MHNKLLFTYYVFCLSFIGNGYCIYYILYMFMILLLPFPTSKVEGGRGRGEEREGEGGKLGGEGGEWEKELYLMV